MFDDSIQLIDYQCFITTFEGGVKKRVHTQIAHHIRIPIGCRAKKCPAAYCGM